MRIAQIAPPWIPIPPKNYGGTESVIYNLVEEQVAQGHNVTLFAPGDAKTSAKLVSFFPNSLLVKKGDWGMHLKAFYHMKKAFDYIKVHKFDIVHTHLSSNTDMYLFPLSASLEAIPHVTTLHSIFPFDRYGSEGKVGDADNYYMDWAACVPLVAISENAREQETLPLHFVDVVHNGIDMSQFPTPRQKREDYLVWLGRFVPEKGPHLAIEAAKQTGMKLILAGTIDRYVKASVNYFHEQIEPQIDNKQIKYIGPVNMRRKVSLLRRAHAFLNPIEWEEPFGMVMVEAMAMGCPVISFARGAAPEIVENGKTGFLVQDLEEMVQCLSRIDEIDREETRLYVEQNFSARVMAENYTRVYKNIIKDNKKG